MTYGVIGMLLIFLVHTPGLELRVGAECLDQLGHLHVDGYPTKSSCMLYGTNVSEGWDIRPVVLLGLPGVDPIVLYDHMGWLQTI